jgi:HPt (histidine-containing phosphotransfer) domain-containing protein
MDYKLINPEYLESVTGGEISIISELVDMFKEQVIEIHAEMKLYYSERDYKQVGLLAHKAKSSVAIMGMSELADMLKTLEYSAKTGLIPEMYELYINKFYDDTQAAVIELDDYLSKMTSRASL